MAEKIPQSVEKQEPELVITRLIDAPRSLVYQAWTDPEHLKHRQGAPRGFTVTVEEKDVRPGGRFRICMRSPERGEHWLQGTYREVIPPERLVFTHCWLNADGKSGKETLVTIVFKDCDGKTELTLRQTGFKSVESGDGHEQGWASTLERFNEYVATLCLEILNPDQRIKIMTTKTVAEEPGDNREIVITRALHAPREMVWNAMVDPQQVANWWGPHGFTITVHEMDVRPGGIWRYTMHGPDGTDYTNHCVFQEVVHPERVVFSLVGEKNGDTDAAFDAIWTFESVDAKTTRVTIRLVFASAAARDRVVKEHGAIEGGKQTLERLAVHLVAVESGMYRSIVITRTYPVPPSVVFKAWIDPKQLANWWGPKGFTNPVCEVDARVGGAWRIVMRAPDGAEYPCGGVYREITEPHQLVFTNIAPDKDGKPIMNGLTAVIFEEIEGTTKLTLRTQATAVVQYAAAYLNGMDAGWSQSLDRLTSQLAKL